MVTDAWWEQKGDDAAACLYAEIKAITAKDSSRLNSLQRYLKLYTGRNNITVNTYDLISRLKLTTSGNELFEESLRYNVIQSAINTLHSKICKRREKVRFLTSDGSYEEQRNARRADRLLYGLFKSAQVHEINMLQTLDSYWSGSGFVQVGHRIRKGKVEICLHRIQPSEIIVDFEDAENGDPVTLRRIKAVPVETLIKAYPQFRNRIELLQMNRSGFQSSYDSVTKRVLVAEAWHLPQDDGSGGRHILAIENAILDEEPYTEFEFPIIKQDFLWAPFGYFAIGMAELLQGHQREMDALLAFRQVCLKRASNPRTYVERASNVSDDQLTNEANAIVHYNGTPPVQETRPPYADQLFRDIEDIYQKAYREVGISEMAAASQKPAGLNSGKALREFADIESERFQTIGQMRQQAHVDIAKAMIREIKKINQLAKTNKDYRKASRTVTGYDREYGFESFKLEDLEMIQDEYMIQAHNVSMFPQKPEGQLEFAQELASAGLIDQNDALELLDFPDTSAVLNRQLSATRFTRRTIEKMLDSGVYIGPDPYENHSRNMQIALQYYNEGKLRDYDEEKQNLIIQYMDDNNAFLKKAQEDQAAQAQAQQGMPMPEGQLPPAEMGMPEMIPQTPNELPLA